MASSRSNRDDSCPNTPSSEPSPGRPTKQDDSDLFPYCRWVPCAEEGFTPAQFKTNEEARRHEIRDHVMTQSALFWCGINDCGSAEFDNREILLNHVNRVHGIRKFVCDNCRVRFREEDKLVRHRQKKTPCSPSRGSDPESRVKNQRGNKVGKHSSSSSSGAKAEQQEEEMKTHESKRARVVESPKNDLRTLANAAEMHQQAEQRKKVHSLLSNPCMSPLSALLESPSVRHSNEQASTEFKSWASPPQPPPPEVNPRPWEALKRIWDSPSHPSIQQLLHDMEQRITRRHDQKERKE